ncbi:MarR family winged helix-turn-helix transcriptional regulator [Microbacterium sp. JZ31]|uniref:MarR family winged helix-turn-helix transcriptional regulator n=1 Tax=Microbacterium sp. JZ31 TaxID=1906274 RepID=UPI001932CA52|nr:MarR family winged helix-turn-helix transcriptional regulator [Microbacterium sp. JZ31]
MTESRDPVAQIAEALARLRGLGRFGGPPWAGRSPWDVQSRGGHHHGGPEHRGHGGPFAGPPHGGPLGRGVARLRLLEELARAGGPQTVGALAEALGVDQPRASRLVQAAVQMGLARREADPSDARRTLVALTDQGRAIVDRSRGARSDAVSRALDGFSADERAQLASLLTRLADAWPR